MDWLQYWFLKLYVYIVMIHMDFQLLTIWKAIIIPVLGLTGGLDVFSYRVEEQKESKMDFIQLLFEPVYLLVAVTVLLSCLYIFSGKRYTNLPPGPKPWPIIGMDHHLFISVEVKEIYIVDHCLHRSPLSQEIWFFPLKWWMVLNTCTKIEKLDQCILDIKHGMGSLQLPLLCMKPSLQHSQVCRFWVFIFFNFDTQAW
jgi:hypothetical protein